MAKTFTHVWEKARGSGFKQRITVNERRVFEYWVKDDGASDDNSWTKGDEPYSFELQEIILGNWTKLEEW